MDKQTLYVAGLDRGAKYEDVQDVFGRYGKVIEVKMKENYCFVEFENVADAELAINKLDGSEQLCSGGRTLKVEKGKQEGRGPGGGGAKGPRETGQNRVRVEGLGGATSWQDLKDFARKAGQPTFTNVYRDQGIGIVEFAHPDDVRTALRVLDGQELGGRDGRDMVRVRVVEDRPSRGGDRGGGYGGRDDRGGRMSGPGGGGGGYGGGRDRYEGGGGYGRERYEERGYDRYDDRAAPSGYGGYDRGGGGGGGYDRGGGGGGGGYMRDDRGGGGYGGGYAGGSRGGYEERAPYAGSSRGYDERDRYGGGGRDYPPPRDRSPPRGYGGGGRGPPPMGGDRYR